MPFSSLSASQLKLSKFRPSNSHLIRFCSHVVPPPSQCITLPSLSKFHQAILNKELNKQDQIDKSNHTSCDISCCKNGEHDTTKSYLIPNSNCLPFCVTLDLHLLEDPECVQALRELNGHQRRQLIAYIFFGNPDVMIDVHSFLRINRNEDVNFLDFIDATFIGPSTGTYANRFLHVNVSSFRILQFILCANRSIDACHRFTRCAIYKHEPCGENWKKFAENFFLHFAAKHMNGLVDAVNKSKNEVVANYFRNKNSMASAINKPGKYRGPPGPSDFEQHCLKANIIFDHQHIFHKKDLSLDMSYRARSIIDLFALSSIEDTIKVPGYMKPVTITYPNLSVLNKCHKCKGLGHIASQCSETKGWEHHSPPPRINLLNNNNQYIRIVFRHYIGNNFRVRFAKETLHISEEAIIGGWPTYDDSASCSHIAHIKVSSVHPKSADDIITTLNQPNVRSLLWLDPIICNPIKEVKQLKEGNLCCHCGVLKDHDKFSCPLKDQSKEAPVSGSSTNALPQDDLGYQPVRRRLYSTIAARLTSSVPSSSTPKLPSGPSSTTSSDSSSTLTSAPASSPNQIVCSNVCFAFSSDDLSSHDKSCKFVHRYEWKDKKICRRFCRGTCPHASLTECKIGFHPRWTFPDKSGYYHERHQFRTEHPDSLFVQGYPLQPHRARSLATADVAVHTCSSHIDMSDNIDESFPPENSTSIDYPSSPAPSPAPNYSTDDIEINLTHAIAMSSSTPTSPSPRKRKLEQISSKPVPPSSDNSTGNLPPTPRSHSSSRHSFQSIQGHPDIRYPGPALDNNSCYFDAIGVLLCAFLSRYHTSFEHHSDKFRGGMRVLWEYYKDYTANNILKAQSRLHKYVVKKKKLFKDGQVGDPTQVIRALLTTIDQTEEVKELMDYYFSVVRRCRYGPCVKDHVSSQYTTDPLLHVLSDYFVFDDKGNCHQITIQALVDKLLQPHPHHRCPNDDCYQYQGSCNMEPLLEKEPPILLSLVFPSGDLASKVDFSTSISFGGAYYSLVGMVMATNPNLGGHFYTKLLSQCSRADKAVVSGYFHHDNREQNGNVLFVTEDVSKMIGDLDKLYIIFFEKDSAVQSPVRKIRTSSLSSLGQKKKH